MVRRLRLPFARLDAGRAGAPDDEHGEDENERDGLQTTAAHGLHHRTRTCRGPERRDSAVRPADPDPLTVAQLNHPRCPTTGTHRALASVARSARSTEGFEMNGENLQEQLGDAYEEIRRLNDIIVSISTKLGVTQVDTFSDAWLLRVLGEIEGFQDMARRAVDTSYDLGRVQGLMGVARKNYKALRQIEEEPVTEDGAEREQEIRDRLEAALGIKEFADD